MQNTGEPGSAFSVQIRGANSIQGSNEPLYVLDGFLTTGSSLDMLNSLDIESVEVLKDASATAIYGSRGANGVVLITTKQGKAGKTTVDFESSFGSQSLSKKLDFMNASEYAQLYNEQAVNDGLEPYFSPAEISAYGSGYDWQDFIFQPALILNNTLSVNGGNEKTRFSISGNVLNQDGIIKGTGFKRYSLKTNISHEISKMFSVEFSTVLTKNIIENESNTAGGDRGNTLLSGAMVAPPTLTPYYDDGSYRVLATEHPFLSGNIINPVNFLNEDNRQTDKNYVLTNTALLFEPIEGLVLKIYGGLQNIDSRYDHYRTLNFLNSSGTADVAVSNNLSLLNENTITYSKVFRERHNFSAVAGFTYQNFTIKSLSGSGSGFLSDITETYDLSAASNPGIPASGYTESVLLSYLGRVNYVFDNKYLFTASIRADGSSKYSEGNKWGYFPSAAFAWKMKNEAFMQDISFIEDFKFRASWGLTGSQAISPYQTLTQLQSGLAVFDDNLYVTFAPGSKLPGDLKWETTEQIDFGIDIGLFRNRHRFTADYYIKNTRDLLNPVGLPSSLGYITTVRNVGSIQNSGFEFAFDSRILTGEFKWALNLNISFNKNKVVSLYDGQDILTGSFFHPMISDYGKILREGEAVGVFYGYVTDGYDDIGNEVYKDLNSDGEINELDKTIIGDPNPDFIYGLNSTMSFKNFTLDIFIQGSQGNDILNVSGISTIDYQGGLNTLREVYSDHWTEENTNAKYPKITKFVTGRYSDRQIEDGSYLKFKNIQLSYSLPLKNMQNSVLSKVQVYANMDNLLTFSQYSWWDPEVNSQGQGVDLNSYPKARTYSVGIKLSF
jgi:TonB-linked SusC/RagA family outer membrane protein